MTRLVVLLLTVVGFASDHDELVLFVVLFLTYVSKKLLVQQLFTDVRPRRKYVSGLGRSWCGQEVWQEADGKRSHDDAELTRRLDLFPQR